MADENRAFGWDDEIKNDGGEFILLPDGDYDFTVVKFTRAQHDGSENLPACPKAIMDIRIQAPEGTVTIKHNLFLHKRCEGLLCDFFTGIGQRKRGEAIKPQWAAVVGASGRLKLGTRIWKSSKTGEEMKSNEIKKFYEPAAPMPPAQAVPTANFTPGAF